MKALVVGLGSAGRRHARNWAALGLGPVSICRATDTPQPEPLGVDASVYRDLGEALAASPDVTIVANPSSLHVETARAAVRAGSHVLVEKPLGASLEGVGALLDEARATGRHVMVGYNLRFHPGLARARDLLHAGAIGRPVSARAEMGEYLPGWHPWEDYRAGYAGRRALGGGPVLTFSHELDSVCWLLGRPLRVTAVARRASPLEVDTEDVAEMIVEFAGGVLASVHVDYVRQPPRRFVEIVGDAGVLRWEYDENRLLHYMPPAGQWRIEQGNPSFARNDLFLEELRRVADVVHGRDPDPLPDGRQGAAILALALAALQSSAGGRSVDLSTLEDGDACTWLSSLEFPPPSPSFPPLTSSASTDGSP